MLQYMLLTFKHSLSDEIFLYLNVSISFDSFYLIMFKNTKYFCVSNLQNAPSTSQITTAVEAESTNTNDEVDDGRR